MPSAFVACIAAIPLGLARAAIDAMTELAGTKTPVGSASPLREKPMLQGDVARAEALLRSGRAFMLEELQRYQRQLEELGAGNASNRMPHQLDEVIGAVQEVIRLCAK